VLPSVAGGVVVTLVAGRGEIARESYNSIEKLKDLGTEDTINKAL
jgi:hypothetical protein